MREYGRATSLPLHIAQELDRLHKHCHYQSCQLVTFARAGKQLLPWHLPSPIPPVLLKVSEFVVSRKYAVAIIFAIHHHRIPNACWPSAVDICLILIQNIVETARIVESESQRSERNCLPCIRDLCSAEKY